MVKCHHDPLAEDRLPKLPKHTRPICVTCAAEKIFSRVVLARCKDKIRLLQPWQAAGANRQCADFLFTLRQLMELEREWQKGLRVMVVDFTRAFDSINPDRLLSKLVTCFWFTDAWCVTLPVLAWHCMELCDSAAFTCIQLRKTLASHAKISFAVSLFHSTASFMLHILMSEQHRPLRQCRIEEFCCRSNDSSNRHCARHSTPIAVESSPEAEPDQVAQQGHRRMAHSVSGIQICSGIAVWSSRLTRSAPTYQR